jgi:glycosyltransferase involved in cell wall biosynthesis
MRIAVNTRMLLRDKLEGIGWYTYEVLRRLVKDRQDDTFIFLFDRPWDPDFIFGENVIPVEVFPPARHPVLFYWWFERRLPGVLRQYKADVFFSPDGFLSLRTPLPTLLTVHDLAYKHFEDNVNLLQQAYYRYYMPRFLRRADLITTVSEATRQDVIASGIAPDKVSVAWNGTDPRFKPAGSETSEAIRQEFTGGRPFFLYVGAIHPRKNVAGLVRAFSEFKLASGAPHHLVLLGRMAWKTAEVEEAIQQSPFRDAIVQVGYQKDRLPAFYSAATALVYVSLFEGFGMPLTEAMGCDTAIITSNLSSMPEVCGDAGLLVDPYSRSSIAGAMLRLVADEGLRQSLIQRGRQQRLKFSWETTARDIGRRLEILSAAGQPTATKGR